jgi:hypothetical protein
MAFDPITYNEVLSGKNPVGTLLRVVSDFQDPKYIDSGASFSSDLYPDLATKVPGGFQGDYVKEIPIASLPSSFSSSSAALGSYLIGFVSDGKMNFLFASSGVITRYTSVSSNMADGIVFNGYFVVPGGTGSDTVTPEMSVNNDGTFMYASLADRHYRFDLSDPTLATYKRFTLPTSTNRYKFADGNGLIMAAAGNISVSGNIHYSSNGGDSWTVGGIATNTAGSSPQGLSYGAGVFVMVTAASTNNITRSADGVTWTTQTAGSIGHNAVKFNPVLSLFVTTPFNTGAAYSSPTGVTWTARTSINGQQRVISISSLTGDMICSPTSNSSGANSGFWRSSNGTSWANRQTTTPFSTTTNNAYRAIYAVDSFPGFAIAFTGPANTTGYGPMLYSFSTDSGATWSSVRNVPPTNATTKAFRPPVMSSSGDKIVLMETLASGNDQVSNTWNGILSTDGGDNWQAFAISAGTEMVYWKEVIPTFDNKLIAWGQASNDTATARAMCTAVTSDGASWQYTSYTALPVGLQSITPSTVAIGNDNRLYFGNNSTSTGAMSADYGATWTQKALPFTGGKLVSFKSRIMILVNGQVPRYTVDGATNWLTGQLSSLPATTPIGFAANDRVAVAVIANSASFYYTYDGVIWMLGTLPASMPGSVGIINDWIMFPTGAGSIYRTKDFTNWDLVVIGDDNKYSTMALSSISSNPAGSEGFFHGVAANNTAGYLLKADTEVTDRRRLPVIASDLPHTKWVVLAK